MLLKTLRKVPVSSSLFLHLTCMEENGAKRWRKNGREHVRPRAERCCNLDATGIAAFYRICPSFLRATRH